MLLCAIFAPSLTRPLMSPAAAWSMADCVLKLQIIWELSGQCVGSG
jgi:hypothetical protein